MRNKLLAIILFAATICAKANAQSGVYLYIPTITAGAGTSSHTDEVSLNSVQQGEQLPVSYSGSGSTTGKPDVSDVVFTKGFDRSSLRLQNALFRGLNTPFAEIRYYTSTSSGTSTLVYVLRVENFYVNGYSSSNADCNSGCPGLSESISFSYTTIIFRNLAVTPNQVLTYSKATNITTFTQ